MVIRKSFLVSAVGVALAASTAFAQDERMSFFITSEGPSIRAMARHSGSAGLLALFHIDPFRKMARSLKRFFKNPKLVQLFARYAT